MIVIDPGHRYAFSQLDGDEYEYLNFVKRVGSKFPGNKTAYPGTNLQEVWRGSIDRLQYLNNQEPHMCSELAIAHVRNAIKQLEIRAAERHGRDCNSFINAPEIEKLVVCYKCGHIGCEGECHA